MTTTKTLQTKTGRHERNIVQGHGGFIESKNSIPTAHEVVKSIRVKLSHIEYGIRHHVFLHNLRDGKAPIRALKAFAGHQYHIINSDVRSSAMMVQRFGEPMVHDFFQPILQDEFGALEPIVVLSKKLGMTVEGLKEYPLIPEGFACAAYMGWLSPYASAAEILASALVHCAAWAYNCGHMSHSLKDRYGFTHEDTVFFDAFAALPSFESAALHVIQSGLDAGGILRVCIARLSSYKVIRKSSGIPWPRLQGLRTQEVNHERADNVTGNDVCFCTERYGGERLRQ